MLRIRLSGCLLLVLCLCGSGLAPLRADEENPSGTAAEKMPPEEPATAKPRAAVSAELRARSLGSQTRNASFHPLHLIQKEQVQKELQVQPEQLAKAEQLQAAFVTAFSAAVPKPAEFAESTPEELVKKRQGLLAKREELSQEYSRQLLRELKPAQAQRLREIAWQLRGVEALKDPDLVKLLKVNRDQLARFEAIDEEAVGKRGELLTGIREGTAEQATLRERLNAIQETRDAGFLAALTPAQRKQYQKLQGKKFQLTASRTKRAAPAASESPADAAPAEDSPAAGEPTPAAPRKRSPSAKPKAKGKPAPPDAG
jgi:hypothetical protein